MPAIAIDAKKAVRAWVLTAGDARFVLLDFAREALSGDDLHRKHVALSLLKMMAEVTGQYHGAWKQDWQMIAAREGLSDVSQYELHATLNQKLGADLSPADYVHGGRARMAPLPLCSELLEPATPYLTPRDSALFRSVDEQRALKADRMFAH